MRGARMRWHALYAAMASVSGLALSPPRRGGPDAFLAGRALLANVAPLLGHFHC